MHLRVLLAALILVGGGYVAAGEPLRIERLAVSTAGGAGQPSVAFDAREGFVLTWLERSGRNATLRFAVIDRSGRERRRGAIASGENWFVNWADFPSLVVLENGDWVAHYLEKSAAATYAYDVRIVRSRDRGRSWSAPVTPHDDGTATEHGFVSFAPLNADRVLVAWLDGRRTATASGATGHGADGHVGHGSAGAMTLRSAVLDGAGRLTEEREIDPMTCDCCQTDAVRIGSRTLIAWRDRTAEEIRDITFAARGPDGTWSKPLPLHADGWRIEACPVNGPALAAAGDAWLAVWPTHTGEVPEVRYTVRAGGRGTPMRRLGSGAGTQGRVDAVAWRGGFLVSWLGEHGGQSGLQLAHLDAVGEVLARQTATRLPPTRMSGHPRMAADGDRALLAWVTHAGAGGAGALGVALVYR